MARTTKVALLVLLVVVSGVLHFVGFTYRKIKQREATAARVRAELDVGYQAQVRQYQRALRIGMPRSEVLKNTWTQERRCTARANERSLLIWAANQPGLRHSIIHANLPTPHSLDVIANLQKQYDAGYPEMQSEFLWWIGDIYAGNYGPKRGQSLEPFKTLYERGILWSGGSDYSVTPLAARYGLWAAVARQTAKGTYGMNPFGIAEAIDMHTALRSYTAWGSRQMFLENKIGSLEVGKRADIAIWDRDLYSVPREQIKDMKCLMTLIDGEVVYGAAGSPLRLSRQ